jgi:predicted phosphodiesterase
MMFAFCGDTHGNITAMYEYLIEWEQRTGQKINYVIHVGDFGIYLPANHASQFADYWTGKRVVPVPTYVCPGNHEEWAVIKWWSEQPNKMKDLHLIPNGGVVEVGGFKFGAVWGNYSYKSYKNPERIHTARLNNPFSPKTNHIEKAAVDRLLSAGEIDVLITHDNPQGMNPSSGPIPDFIAWQIGVDEDEIKQSSMGCKGFVEIHETNKPKLHYFGHHHKRMTLQLDPVRVTCLHAFDYSPEGAVDIVTLERDTGGELQIRWA